MKKDTAFINKIPLAVSVATGAATWLMLVFFTLVSFFGGGKTPEFYPAEPSGKGPQPKCFQGVKSITLSSWCQNRKMRMASVDCYGKEGNLIGNNQSTCQPFAYFYDQAVKICAKFQECKPPLPSPVPWPSVKPPEPKPTPFPSPSVISCTVEGEMMPVYPGFRCCEGLTPIPISKPMADDFTTCSKEIGSQICARCPDGVCGLGETFCNCPEDCPAPTF